jgi:hypothetical protein
VRLPAPPQRPPREIVHRITIARAVRPTPSPTPKPTPTPIPHTHVIGTPEPVVASHPHAGKAAPHSPIHREGSARPAPPVIQQPQTVAALPTGGEATGAGAARNAGSLGDAGNGNANGGEGSGNGGGGTQPCGYVDFSNVGTAKRNPESGEDVTIRMTVHFPDGTSESEVLDYPWHYASAAEDPWSEQNISRPFPTTFQSPPADRIAGESPLVQYVVKHTTPIGTTVLAPCPGTSPPA